MRDGVEVGFGRCRLEVQTRREGVVCFVEIMRPLRVDVAVVLCPASAVLHMVEEMFIGFPGWKAIGLNARRELPLLDLNLTWSVLVRLSSARGSYVREEMPWCLR